MNLNLTSFLVFPPAKVKVANVATSRQLLAPARRHICSPRLRLPITYGDAKLVLQALINKDKRTKKPVRRYRSSAALSLLKRFGVPRVEVCNGRGDI